MKSRAVSAPYFLMISSGSTTFPLDLDILAPSFMTMPWVRRLRKGSRTDRYPISARALVKNLA
ncbi:MAG: hypothetical protein BWY88_00374 [Synergistetes bacterium ADurb.Bin520]|nr:MAG: hypothetical protein BWY88_00374 [Synergistetes bacterium ADurb.Bin520]